MTRGRRGGFGPWRLLLPLGLCVAAAAVMLHSHQLDREQARLAAALDASVYGAARLSASRAASLQGTPEGFQALRAAELLVPGLLEMLSQDFPPRALTPPAPDSSALREAWREAQVRAAAVRELSAQVLGLERDAERLQSVATGLLVSGDELVDALLAAQARPVQVRAAARQLVLVQRISTNLRRLMDADAGLLVAADRLGRDAVVFGEVATGLLNGSKELGIPRVEDADAREVLAAVGREFRVLAQAVEEVMAAGAGRVALGRRGEALGRAVSRLNSLNDQMRNALSAREQQRLFTAGHAVQLLGLAVLGLAAALVLGLADRRAARRHRDGEQAATARELGDLETARHAVSLELEQLATDIARMADGDLGLRAHTDSAENAAVGVARAGLDRLRRQLGERSEDGLRMAHGGLLMAEVGSRLRDTARRHATQAEEAGQATRIMAAALDVVRLESVQVSDVARDSGASAQAAGAALTETLHELDAVQAAVEDSADRVRALEAAARELRAVRTLVEDVGELGKMLSLNVAIQASVDSAASRALGAFSDEVQRLATRARSAVSQVESIHDELRSEAERAATAVKESVWRARGAAERARGARVKLEDLSTVSRRLEERNHALGRAHREHAVHVTELIRAMTAMHALTREMREQVDAAADSADALGETAAALERRLAPPAQGDDSVIDLAATEGVARSEDQAASPATRGAASGAHQRALGRWT